MFICLLFFFVMCDCLKHGPSMTVFLGCFLLLLLYLVYLVATVGGSGGGGILLLPVPWPCP